MCVNTLHTIVLWNGNSWFWVTPRDFFFNIIVIKITIKSIFSFFFLHVYTQYYFNFKYYFWLLLLQLLLSLNMYVFNNNWMKMKNEWENISKQFSLILSFVSLFPISLCVISVLFFICLLSFINPKVTGRVSKSMNTRTNRTLSVYRCMCLWVYLICRLPLVIASIVILLLKHLPEHCWVK